MVRQTSIMSYIQLYNEELGERQRAVEKALKEYGPLTDLELMKRLGFTDPNKVRPRRKELYDYGLVVACGTRKCSVSGRNVTEWDIIRSDVV